MLEAKQWLKQLKSAVITNNIAQIRELGESMSQFDAKNVRTTEQKQEALYFLEQAINALQQENKRIGQDMQQIKTQQQLNKSLKYPQQNFLQAYL